MVKRQLKRPPSKLSSLRKAIEAALPGGLPKPVAKFYAQGDGLKLTIDGSTAVLAGLEAMFDGRERGLFRPHAPIRRASDVDGDDFEWLGRPFYERFFNESFELGEGRTLAQLNRLLRLKLLASIEGESAELAIDYFDGPTPTLYLVEDARDAFKLKLSFEEFVEHFSRFGTRRWYYAFLDKAAGKTMNVDLRAELEKSLAGFPADEVEPLRKRFPRARAPKPAPAAAAEPAKEPEALSLVEKWAAEAREALEETDDELHFPWVKKQEGAWDAFQVALEQGGVSLEAVWAIEDAAQYVPAAKLPALLQAPRRKNQDKLWRRLSQVLGPTILKAVKERPAVFSALKLDPLMGQLMELIRLIAGVQPPGTASKEVVKATGEWAFAPPWLKNLPNRSPFPSPYSASKALRHEREGLVQLAKLLTDDARVAAEIRSALDRCWAAKKWRNLAPAGVLLAAPTFELTDLVALTRYRCSTDALEIMSKERGWTKAQVSALAKAASGGFYEKKLVGEHVPGELEGLAKRL